MTEAVAPVPTPLDVAASHLATEASPYLLHAVESSAFRALARAIARPVPPQEHP